MKKKNMKNLDTLYVQVDNTSANKCYTVIIGLASLVALGICKKMVFGIFVSGTHTHRRRKNNFTGGMVASTVV